MSVSIYSYRGEVTVGLMVDAVLIPDPDQIVVALERELDALAKLPAKRPAKRPARAARPRRQPVDHTSGPPERVSHA